MEVILKTFLFTLSVIALAILILTFLKPSQLPHLNEVSLPTAVNNVPALDLVKNAYGDSVMMLTPCTITGYEPVDGLFSLYVYSFSWVNSRGDTIPAIAVVSGNMLLAPGTKQYFGIKEIRVPATGWQYRYVIYTKEMANKLIANGEAVFKK